LEVVGVSEDGHMTKGERTELCQLVRKRERVMKAAASERSIKLLAEFDAQSAQIYSFDDDDVWKRATEAATDAVREAQKMVAERCADLGIPSEFQPGLSFGWYGRGTNAVASRRQELRRKVKSRIEAMEQEARTQIEHMSLNAQTEIVANGLQSEAARAFLDRMPSIDTLMPQVDIQAIRSLVERRPVAMQTNLISEDPS
jgi:hypothetical protein